MDVTGCKVNILQNHTEQADTLLDLSELLALAERLRACLTLLFGSKHFLLPFLGILASR
jgi:hypothetical protein